MCWCVERGGVYYYAGRGGVCWRGRREEPKAGLALVEVSYPGGNPGSVEARIGAWRGAVAGVCVRGGETLADAQARGT